MSSHLFSLLQQWYPLRDQANWVLGTVYKTEGPAYRKAGAMMLFSDAGHQLGMLSGGCLESDIHLHARKVMLKQQAVTLTYDGSDEDDLAFQLGIGCGGTVYILLQPLTAENRYLQLDAVLDALQHYGGGSYRQLVTAYGAGSAPVSAQFVPDTEQQEPLATTALIEQDAQSWLQTRISAPPHLLIAGGGIDARPLANMAQQLGWRVSLWDPRPANGRPEYFPHLHQRLTGNASELTAFACQTRVSAVVLMSHSVSLDAQALAALAESPLAYLALLGPLNRRAKVLEQAGVSLLQLPVPLAGPAGLDLGAELPETIALSILAECQAAIAQRSGASLSQVLVGNTLQRKAS